MGNNIHMIRISKYNPVLANDCKTNKLLEPFNDYGYHLQSLVDYFIYATKVPKRPNKSVTNHITMPSAITQVVGCHASSIARSIRAKVDKARCHKEKGYRLKKYQKELIRKYGNQSLHIEIKNFNIELDDRFIDIQPSNDTTICDYWIRIVGFRTDYNPDPITGRCGRTNPFYIPMKLTNHMKDLISRGFTLKTNNIRVNQDGTLGIYFYKEDQINPNTKEMGIDLGRNKLIATSDNTFESTHRCGKTVKEILKLIGRSDPKSKRSKRLRSWLINQINYCLHHDIPWDNLKHLIMEDLFDIKRNNKWGKQNQFWRVGYTMSRIKQLCEENDVRLTHIDAAYTSQMCSVCGDVHSDNRSEEQFSCIGCGMEMDADYNAAINIYDKGTNSSFTKKFKI